MKQYQDYIKQFKIFLFISFLFLPLFLTRFFTFAQNVTDIQNQINQKNVDISNLEKEITIYQNELDNIGKQKSSLNQSLKTLDLNKKKLNTDISITQKKVEKTNNVIGHLNSDILNKENNIDTDTKSIESQIKNMNEYDRYNLYYLLLSGAKISSTWIDIDNMNSVSENIRKNILNLQQVKNELNNVKKRTLITKNELTNLKSQLSDQQKIIIQNAKEKSELLKQTKNNEKNYQSLLKDRIAKRDAFEKELSDYEAKLKFSLDPSKLPSSRVLSWPLEKVYVTQLFGKTVDSRRLYASGSHNGVDFRASVGTPVLSMADGVVLGTGNTDLTCRGASFGKFVFIKYDNGLSSTFGHLSLIKVNEGDKVARGQVVGYSGSTGHATGPHLHVSLYASEAVKMDSKPSAACGGRVYRLPVAPINAYLDAMYYLPTYAIDSSTLINKVTE